MKKYIYALVVLAFFACKNNNPEVKTAPTQTTHENTPTPSDLNETKTKVDVTFQDSTFTAIYNAYLDLKGSLVNTDASKAKETANAMFVTIGEDYKAKGLVKAIQKIEGSNDVEAQRTAFEDVSKIMEALISENEITSGAIYKQYCPMAFNGKGAYWLSNSNEVRNPYFGDVMLKCGVVDKEIK